ncbi:MAG: hypothetical protein KIT83_20795 [Bryobacterales bacterium]|nr:hypothetical protein [Bryobacterales bacterium]
MKRSTKALGRKDVKETAAAIDAIGIGHNVIQFCRLDVGGEMASSVLPTIASAIGSSWLGVSHAWTLFLPASHPSVSAPPLDRVRGSICHRDPWEATSAARPLRERGRPAGRYRM